MTQGKVLYGNVTLSQLTHFIVEVCGKDALLSKANFTDSEINDAYKEKGSYLKFRFTDENSLFGKVFKFFTTLEKEFDVPLLEIERKKSLDGKYFEKIKISDFQNFYSYIIWNYIIQICGTRPFENTQNNLSKKILFSYLLKQPSSYFADYINLCSDVSFGLLFDEFIKNENINFEDFYYEIGIVNISSVPKYPKFI